MNFLRLGMTPAQSQKLTKELKGSGLRPQVANRYSKLFTYERKKSVTAIETYWNKRIPVRETGYYGQNTGKFKFRYLTEVEFTAVNPITNESFTKHMTFGLHRLDTGKKIFNEIKSRLSFLSNEARKRYFGLFTDIDIDSLEIKGLIRTNIVG